MKTPKLRMGLLCALALTAILGMSQPASAQANVDIDITLQGITILHYFSNLDVTIDSTAMAQMLGYAGTLIDEGTAGAITGSAHPFSGDADLPTAIGATKRMKKYQVR